MVKSHAILKGSVLYIDGFVWAEDVTLDEAIEEINAIQELPNAPTGVRVIQPVRHRRRSQVGWPEV